MIDYAKTTLPDVVAELKYQATDKATWSAIVTKPEESGTTGYLLWFRHGGHYQKSGTFENSKALIKFIREKAEEKFPGHEPLLDTLSRLQGMSAESVVPECYGRLALDFNFQLEGECKSCPYRTDCIAFVREPKAEQVECESEPEELFLHRLRGKVADKWGVPKSKPKPRPKPEPKPEPVEVQACTECGSDGYEVVPSALGPVKVECQHCKGTGVEPR